MGGIAKQTGCLAGFEDLHADEGAVDQHGKLTGKPVRRGNRKFLGDDLEAPPHFAHVGFGHPAGGVVRLRKLGRCIDLRTAPVIVPPDPFTDPFEMGVEFRPDVVWVLFGHPVPCAPEVLILTHEEGGDQVVLRAEIAVEAGLGDTGFFHHQIDTDGTHAAPVEEVRRRLENSLAGRWWLGRSRWFVSFVISNSGMLAENSLTRYRPVCSI